MGASTTGGTQAAGAGGSQSSGGSGGTSSGGSGGDGGSSAGAGGSGGSAGSGDGGSPDGGAGPCDGFVGLATPAETALTPRDDDDAEILALRTTDDRIVAPEAVYQRVERDLRAIRQGYPDVDLITPFPRAAASSFSMSFDDDTLADVVAGTYTGWDCPNELYGFIGSDPPSLSGTVRVRFEGRFEPSLLVSEYENLPGVTAAWESVGGGDGNDISLDVEGESYHWLFSIGSGDCPAGCINREYWGFTTNAAGDITYHGSSVDDSLDQAFITAHNDRTAKP
jgi:hypothetical protein